MKVQDAPRGTEFLSIVEDRLPKKIFRHVVSVAELMLSIREEAEITAEQAGGAGLLHDRCKTMKGPVLIEAAESYGIAVDDLQRERPVLLHGPVAAEECRRDLALDDEVYEAIYWHTTGRAEWNPVGLALYFADFSEPLRVRPEAAAARERLATQGYRSAVKYVVTAKLAHVEKKYTLDPSAIAFRDWVFDSWA